MPRKRMIIHVQDSQKLVLIFVVGDYWRTLVGGTLSGEDTT